MPSKMSYIDVKKPDNSDRFLSSFWLPYIFIHPISSKFSSKQSFLLLWKAFFDVFIPLSFPDVLMFIPIMLIGFTPSDTSLCCFFCLLLVAQVCLIVWQRIANFCICLLSAEIIVIFFNHTQPLLKPPLSLVPTSSLHTIFLIFVYFYFFKTHVTLLLQCFLIWIWLQWSNNSMSLIYR